VLGSSNDRAADALKRFSSFIPIVIFVLVLSGLSLAIVQLGHISALWSTQYGFVLLVKLALVTLIFAVAAINRYRLSDGAISGEVTPLRHLKRAILGEMVLTLAIIAVLGLWRFTPPPREIFASVPPVQAITIAKDGFSARLNLHPALVGPVTVEIDDLILDGKPFTPMSISLDLEKPAYGIGPFTHEALKTGEGRYIVQGNFLPIDGFWVVKATVLVSDFHSIIATDLFDVQRPSVIGNPFPSTGANTQ
jgi:copper transport protein